MKDQMLEPRLVSGLFLDDDELQILHMAAEEPERSEAPGLAGGGAGNQSGTCTFVWTLRCTSGSTCTAGWTLRCTDAGFTCTYGWTIKCDNEPRTR
jgi:hypothetical protein